MHPQVLTGNRLQSVQISNGFLMRYCVIYPRERSVRIKTQKRFFLVFLLSLKALLQTDPNEFWFGPFYVFSLSISFLCVIKAKLVDIYSIVEPLNLYVYRSTALRFDQFLFFYWCREPLIYSTLMFRSLINCLLTWRYFADCIIDRGSSSRSSRLGSRLAVSGIVKIYR